MTNLVDRQPADVISIAQRIMNQAAAQAETPDPLALDAKLAYNVKQKALGYTEDRDPMPGELALSRVENPHKQWTLQQLPKQIGSLLVREDTGAPLYVVGQQFAIAQNADIHEAFVEGLSAGLPTSAFNDKVTSKQRTAFDGRFARVDIQFAGICETIKQLSGRSTLLNFTAGWANYHGGGSIKCWGAATDLVCSNGMMGNVLSTDAFRHTSSFTPDKLGAFITAEAAKFYDRCKVWQRWALAEITPEDAEDVLKATGNSPAATKHLMAQLDAEAAQRGMTVWALYSALTYKASHNSEEFKVRRTGSDNVATTLTQRETDVSRIISSEAWQRFAA